MRTDPKRFLFRMMLFLAFVGTICALLFAPLKSAFMGNPALNSVILATLGLGVLYVIRQILRLTPERNWLLSIQKTGRFSVLIATSFVQGSIAEFAGSHIKRPVQALPISRYLMPGCP